MPIQRYVSRELTHFVGRNLTDKDSQYSLLVEILNSGWLTHHPHNPNISGNLTLNPKASINAMYSPQVVCFCDIPVEDLAIHVRKYSAFGLAFPKAFLIDNGANPVFYVAANSKVTTIAHLFDGEKERQVSVPTKTQWPDTLFHKVNRSLFFEEMIREYHDLLDVAEEAMSGQAPGVSRDVQRLWRLRHFLDFQIFSFMRGFDDTKSDEDPANFYMEREWRMLGNLRFTISDVARILLPESYANRLRVDVPQYCSQVTFVA
jgi:hypothetical protein